MPVAMYTDPDGNVYGLSQWGPLHTVRMEDASAPEVAGGRVHTVYGGEANTVCELKDLNAPIGIEGEPMQGPAAYDSAKDMAYVGRVADRRRRTMDEVSIKDRCACKGNCGDETCTGTQFETCDGKKANGHQRKREAEQFCRKCCTASARIQITNTPLPPKYPEAPWCKVQGHDKVISPLHGKGKDYADKGDSEGKGACNDHKAKGYYEGKGAGTRNSSSSKGWNGPRNQQIMIMGSSSAAPKAAPPIYRPPEAPPPPLGCPKPPTLISCSGCGVHGRLHGDGPFILRLASSCRQEEEGEGAWSMLAQRRLLAGYTFWCHKCDPTTQLMSTWADTALATPQQTNPPPGLELMDPYHSVGCHSDEEEDHEEEDHEEEEEQPDLAEVIASQTKEEIEEEMRINEFWFSTGPSIEKSELFGRQIQRMFGVQYDPDATRTTFAANADQDETQTPPLPSWPHRLAPFGRIAWQRGSGSGIVQCTKCRSQMEDQYTQHMQMQRMEREEHKRREARTKISEELLIETLRDKVNELETKIDDIHNSMHSEAVVTLLPGVTLRVDEATQTDREDEEWKGSRGPARRGSNESAIAEP